MTKNKMVQVSEWRGTPIFTDGTRYYVPDGFGEYDSFRCEDDAIAHIEGFDLMEGEWC